METITIKCTIQQNSRIQKMAHRFYYGSCKKVDRKGNVGGGKKSLIAGSLPLLGVQGKKLERRKKRKKNQIKDMIDNSKKIPYQAH